MWAYGTQEDNVSVLGCSKGVAVGTKVLGYIGTFELQSRPRPVGRVRNMQCEAKAARHWPPRVSETPR
jgi:hypothetical protein